ncbi:hypothetical protein JQ596_22335 [Bradyrhizobium manausense]|uniref:hypothetical protein n=1 Tax=Bradyrhizobium TaxID=374 RepID=UPI001BAB55F2|nr:MULTISPECIES: hypothetical protein [Bradyrhizobium]MBR0828279.1 hypothetical protein [Bradyrhizobium manausense]UVO25645.1 hypothetical protein KUF59_23965 [Bradyrhizobium arachidis]
MTPAWYVTFESRPRSLRERRRSPRETRTFATEDEAKVFASSKLDEGLIVFAGTINPHLPRRHIPSNQVHQWLSEGQEDAAEASPLPDNE